MRGASRTAEVVCLLRALEALRDDAIVRDTHAATFLRPTWRLALPWMAAAGRVPRPLQGWPGLGTYVAARHRWLDDQLQAAVDDGATDVLVLGAGYDTRALRFPGPRTWEVDHPATAARKASLAPDHPARRVTVDFQRQSLRERLVEEGFPVGCRAYVVWEGVTMYLSRASILRTLEDLASLVGPGSVLGFDAFRVLDEPGFEAHVHRLSPALMPLIGEPVTFFVHPDDVPGMLAPTGWEVEAVEDASALRARYAPDRPLYPACFVVRARWSGRPTGS